MGGLNNSNEIITELTDKLFDGIGWLVTRDTPRKIAVSTFIEDIQKSNYDPVIKAALIYNAKKIVREYSNQNDIVEKALHLLNNDAQPGKIDDSWLFTFMDKARLVSSDDFQRIWSYILASECNVPGTIPIALLYTLEKMDRDDASLFASLCRLTVKYGQECSPLIIDPRLEKYKKFGINYDGLVNLKALGLIETDLGEFTQGYELSTNVSPSKVTYFDYSYDFPDKQKLEIGYVIYTKTGVALYKSITTEKIDGFWEEFCLPFFEKQKGNK